MELLLQRGTSPTGKSTPGTLYVDGKIECATLELPWRNNEHAVSCIPAGRYEVTLSFSQRFQRTMPELLGVPDRSGIRIHPANLPSELKGCIAVGAATDRPDVIDASKIAFHDVAVKLLGVFAARGKAWITIENPAPKSETKGRP